MKNYLRYFCFFVSLVSSSAFCKNQTDWRESFGGNGVIAEFKSLGYSIANFLNGYMPNENLGPRMNLAMTQVEIECVNILYIGGQVKDAVNYPYRTPQALKLNCLHWSELTPLNKYQIVVHELLSLLFIDDSTYALSNEISRAYDLDRNTPNKLQLLLSSIEKCDEITFQKMVESGLDLQSSDSLGRTPITIASFSECPPLLEKLIERGVFFSSRQLSNRNHINLKILLHSLSLAIAASHDPNREYSYRQSLENIRILNQKFLIFFKMSVIPDPAQYASFEFSSNCQTDLGCLPLDAISSIKSVQSNFSAHPTEFETIREQFLKDVRSLGL